MKIRKGFVSNSSSSSFVVLLPKKPETIEELKEMMWQDRKNIFVDYGPEYTITIDEAAESVFKSTQKIFSKDDIISLISYIFYYEPNSYTHNAVYEPKPHHYTHSVVCDNNNNGRWPLMDTKIKNLIDEICDNEKLQQLKQLYITNSQDEKIKGLKMELAEEVYNKLIDKYTDGYIFIDIYYDNDIFGTVMEYGNAWDNVDHIKISMH